MRRLLIVALLVSTPAVAHPEHRHVEHPVHSEFKGAFHRDDTRRQFYDLGERYDQNGRRCETCRVHHYDLDESDERDDDSDPS